LEGLEKGTASSRALGAADSKSGDSR